MRSFPGVTVTTEIKNIAGNLDIQLKDKLGIVDFFFLALDESYHVIWTQPSYSSLRSHYTTSKITKALFTKSKVCENLHKSMFLLINSDKTLAVVLCLFHIFWLPHLLLPVIAKEIKLIER